jgi:hypothetical protein
MIKISLNKELDYEVYTDFWDFSMAGANFGEKIKKDHPNINLENYKKYIDDFYVKNQSELLEKQNEINKLLISKQNNFITELKNIFDIDFSNKTYNGYLSIFNCNPRYLDTETFQIYFKKDLLDMLEVAFHESLHFSFFEYLSKHFSEKIQKFDKNSGILWELSEIINVIILNLPPFIKILEREEMLFYPELKEKLDKAKKIWVSSKNIKDFINTYLDTNSKS